MEMYPRIIVTLNKMIDNNEDLKLELKKCITTASWVPPGWKKPIYSFDEFYKYLNQLMNTTPVESTFDNLFHGIFYIISQDDNKLQKDLKFIVFQEWIVLFTEQYGSFMNSSTSANNLYSFTNDKTFEIDQFQIPPGGFNSFNTFFSRYIKPGKRPIGTKTKAYEPPSEGNPVLPNPSEDKDLIHKNMCDDNVIIVPADSVYKGCWKIDNNNTVKVSKGNRYSIDELLANSKYADRFKNGIFTHSYLTVFTYHRYHVPVRGTVLETELITGQVFADVYKDDKGDLHATDGTGYQFKQDRGLFVIDSPVGLVALLPIGMDFISSCNFSVDKGDYVNKGDEFGYFLFGGSDMIMLFERSDIDIALIEENKFYKLGQVFGRISN